MGQITRTTNPTGLRQIDKRHYVVRVVEGPTEGRAFWIEKFDHSAAQLDSTVQVACIAHSGNTEEYVELGLATAIPQHRHSIRALATDKPLRFRFIFYRTGESQLVAYTDDVRALDEAGNLGSSLVDIEPANLNGIAWKLVLPAGLDAGEKPNVLVEKVLFPTAVSAANSPWFGILVMPEVMRQIAMAIAEEPGNLEDESSWMCPWANFIKALEVETPVAWDEEASKAEWADGVVERFASKGVFRVHMAQTLAELSGETA